MHAPAAGRPSRRRSRAWAWGRLAVGAVILAVLVWRLGAGAFLEPLTRIDAATLVAGVLIALPTTVLSAWRWRLVSRGLGTDLPMRFAIGAYYRSQFLNTVLPGGVLGDVDRAVRRGRDVGDVGHGLRAVVWERTAGQVVQLAVTVLVLLVMPSPVHEAMPFVVVAALVVVGVLVLVLRTVRVSGTAGPARVARAVAGDVREGLLGRGVWPGVLLSSMLVMAGYTAGYYVAVRNAGYHGSAVSMLPLAMLVLAAMSVPASIAGWGPREGVAAWVFAVAGLGAELGVATTVVYGAMVFVASLPGGVLLLLDLLRRGHSEAATLRERRELEPVSVEADRPRTW